MLPWRLWGERERQWLYRDPISVVSIRATFLSFAAGAAAALAAHQSDSIPIHQVFLGKGKKEKNTLDITCLGAKLTFGLLFPHD